MKLASYKGTRPGLQGVMNRLIRWRFDGPYSHSEIVFEPGDGVDHLMHDVTTEPDSDGAYWCASATAAEELPSWSPYRGGKTGGVRFKRIVLDPAKWDLVDYKADPDAAAWYFIKRQGWLYNWRLCFRYVFFWVSLSDKRVHCSESAAAAGGFSEAHRFDPCTLHSAVSRL